MTEEWYLYAFIQGQRKRELQGISFFKATFTAPQISFSKRELEFRVDTGVVEGQKVKEIGNFHTSLNHRL